MIPDGAVAICDSVSRQTLSQKPVVLVARYEENNKAPNSKEILLPFSGNVAMVKACVAMLDRSELSDTTECNSEKVQELPNVSQMKTVTLRVKVPLYFQSKENEKHI